MNYKKVCRGFTLIEILVVMGIIALLATIVLVAINPARQFAQARDAQRTSNVAAILNAVGQRTADYRGTFEKECEAGEIPDTDTYISNDEYDIRDCLVPVYLPLLPFDPEDGVNEDDEYNTGYTIRRDSTTGRVVVQAPSTEIGDVIEASR